MPLPEPEPVLLPVSFKACQPGSLPVGGEFFFSCSLFFGFLYFLLRSFFHFLCLVAIEGNVIAVGVNLRDGIDICFL